MPGRFSRLRCFTFLVAVVFLLSFREELAAQRLPGNVVPENYKLFLDPRMGEGQFFGEETITVRLAGPATDVVLNSLDLDISLAEITAAGKTQQAQITYDKPAEMVHLKLSSPVPAGAAALHLRFSGKLTESLRGLYVSKTPRRAYAVTQFEGTYARLMFPGFDEPAFKATFDLSVMADRGDTAISNGRLVKDDPSDGGRHKLTFSTSPRMSTYLVALAIGDWQCLERTVDGIPVRVCAVPEKKDMGKFALEVAARSLEFYNQWYGIKYPFGKLDMLAIPDYEWGGMENTASIFYRDSALLLDESKASVFAKRGRAGTIAHEIAHQWFGDLVTAAWWDDIWLNEGFATWMSRKPLEAWHPEWPMEEGAAASAQQIISLDSLASARAIHGDPRTSPEIKEMFDGITYEKGGAVLRMLESYLGPEVFRRGVNQYLKEHANGNATSADFWRAMAQVSGKPVDKIMPTFVMQPGVPVVSVDAESCHNGSGSFRLEQRRFLLSEKDSASHSGQLWQIPICMKGGAGCPLLVESSMKLPVDRCPQWFFANRDAKGYYRVAYDPAMLARIAGVAEKELNAPERIALVEDAWAMTRAGKTPVASFMDLARALRAESDRTVIDLLAGHLAYVGDSLVPQERRAGYQIFLRDQFTPLAKQLGWEPRPADSDEQKAMRASLLNILGDAGDPGALAAAQKIVQQYLKSPDAADSTMAGPAFNVAAQNGDSALYSQLTAAMTGAKSTDQYLSALFALAGFRQPELVQHTLELIDQGKVRQQLYPGLFATLLRNPASRDATWSYLKAHWNDLAEKVSSFGGRGAVSALGDFCSTQLRDDVKRFFEGHQATGAELTLQQSLESMDACIAFQQFQQKSMAEWLAGKR